MRPKRIAALAFGLLLISGWLAFRAWTTPSLSNGAQFRILSDSVDRAWYEIDVGKLSSAPLTSRINHVPGFAYFVGISTDSLSGSQCEMLGRDWSAKLWVRISDADHQPLSEIQIDSWLASYPSANYAARPGVRRTCTIYGKARESVPLSRWRERIVDISFLPGANGSSAVFPLDAIVVLDGID